MMSEEVTNSCANKLQSARAGRHQEKWEKLRRNVTDNFGISYDAIEL
jgi:hypothetical protein